MTCKRLIDRKAYMYAMLHTLITSYDVLFYAGKNRHQYADHYVHAHLNIHINPHRPAAPPSEFKSTIQKMH
jgi:hypothetical protein